MNATIASELILIIFSLALIFFGLPLFRSAINVFGFLVGAGYAVYVYYLMSAQLQAGPLWNMIIAVVIALIGGLLGMLLANFAQAIFVFIAGGLVGLMIAKLIGGSPVTEVSIDQVRTMLQLHTIDMVWFIVGGIIFVLAIDTVLIFALCALGASLLYKALFPFHLMSPEWAIPAIIGVFGFFTQMGLANKARLAKKVIVVKEK